MSKEQNKIEIFQSVDKQTVVEVKFEKETVWLSQKQMAELFDKDVRTINELPWHSLFCRTMLIEPETSEHANFDPDFTIINLPSFKADPATMGTNSETVIAVSFS